MTNIKIRYIADRDRKTHVLAVLDKVRSYISERDYNGVTITHQGYTSDFDINHLIRFACEDLGYFSYYIDRDMFGDVFNTRAFADHGLCRLTLDMLEKVWNFTPSELQDMFGRESENTKKAFPDFIRGYFIPYNLSTLYGNLRKGKDTFDHDDMVSLLDYAIEYIEECY